jgi:predicted esterase
MSTHSTDFIHRFVPATGAQTPTLLLLHGTGGAEDSLLELGSSLMPGAALLAPRGQVLENGMPRFFRRLQEGVFDVEDLKARTHQLADFVKQAALDYDLDAQRIVAVGYSNGANIAGSTLLLRPGTLCGAVLLRPMVPLVPDDRPDLSDVAVLVAAGKRDPLVAPDNTRELVSLLQEHGAEVSLRWHQGGHELARDEIEAAREWLQKRFELSAK